MFLLFVKAATAMFFPLLVSLVFSELIGWDRGLQSDALTLAIWDSFKQRSLARILVAVVGMAGLAAMYHFAYKWVDYRLGVSGAFQLQTHENAPAQAILCSVDPLAKQSFSGSVAGTDVILRLDAVHPTPNGSEVMYTILHGGDLQSNGSAFFDRSTCTLTGVPALVAGGRFVQTGNEVTLVATEPAGN